MSEKTIVYTPESGGAGTASLLGMLSPLLSRSGLDASTIAALGNRGGLFGNGDMFSSLIALLVVWGIFGNNSNGNFLGGGNTAATAALGNLINNNDGREMLMNAINGNHESIRDLAATLNVSVSSLQQTLNSINTGIQQVGSQVGMSSMQIINAIQSGNCDLASKLASGFCDVRNAITTQGYENRLATLQQTDAISAKIAEQTTMINDKFCQLEMRELQNKLAASQLENSNLRGEISQAQQNAYLTGFVGQAIAPVNAQLAALNKEVDDIKCKIPSTVNVPYPNLVAMPASQAYGLYGGLGGYGYYGGNGFFG